MYFEKFVHLIFLNSCLCSRVCSQCQQSSSAAFSEWLPKQWCLALNYTAIPNYTVLQYPELHITRTFTICMVLNELHYLCNTLHYNILHYTALHCTVIHCTFLGHNSLHCSALDNPRTSCQCRRVLCVWNWPSPQLHCYTATLHHTATLLH